MPKADTYPLSSSTAPRSYLGVQSGRVVRLNAARRPFARRSTTGHPSPPTISYSATAPSSGVRPSFVTSNVVQPLGSASSSVDGSTGISVIRTNSGAGFEAEFVGGGDLTLGWRCAVSATERVMVFVDGLPCMSTWATPSVGTTAGNLYYVTVNFADTARHKVEILLTGANAFVGVYVPINATISPTPKKPVVLLVGDSFLAGSAAVTDSSLLPAARLWTMYDCNVLVAAAGGTGYSNPGATTTFGDATRVQQATDAQPDKIIFIGSVNDDGRSGIQAAAQACFEAYRAAAPHAEMYAFGVQPTNATDTLSANRSANAAAVRTAALAAGVTFFDAVGTADGIPAAFSTSTTYVAGDLSTRYGAVWRCLNPTATTYGSSAGPGQNRRWELVTFDLWGTGNAGATASDGSRDVFLSSDGVHPTAAGCAPWAARIAACFA